MRRMTTRPALGPCVSFKLDEDTHLKLVNAKERSGRSKAGEVVLRVKDHLLRYPDFYPTVTYLSLIHISEPTRPVCSSRMPSSA